MFPMSQRGLCWWIPVYQQILLKSRVPNSNGSWPNPLLCISCYRPRVQLRWHGWLCFAGISTQELAPGNLVTGPTDQQMDAH